MNHFQRSWVEHHSGQNISSRNPGEDEPFSEVLGGTSFREEPLGFNTGTWLFIVSSFSFVMTSSVSISINISKEELWVASMHSSILDSSSSLNKSSFFPTSAVGRMCSLSDWYLLLFSSSSQLKYSPKSRSTLENERKLELDCSSFSEIPGWFS